MAWIVIIGLIVIVLSMIWDSLGSQSDEERWWPGGGGL